MAMGRPRQKRKDLPTGMRCINGRYYFQSTAGGKRESVPLGSDLTEARRKWAEITTPKQTEFPEAGTFAEIIDRYLEDVLPAKKKDGSFKLAEKTRTEYERQAAKLRKTFGERRYAKTETEAAKGGFIRRMDIAAHLREADRNGRGISANREVALMSSMFRYAGDWGLTEYNPCLGVHRNEETPRDREPTESEITDLLEASNQVMKLIIRFERITGWRETDIRLLHVSQITDEGIALRQSKRGKKQLWEWTDELHAIIEEAKGLRGAVRGLHVFCNRLGQPYTINGFQSMWSRTLERANRKREKDGQPQIVNLHFHDLRAKAINDAVEEGQDGTAFAGHSDPRVTRDHYLRRPTRVKPLK